jgi:hypothetical protein
MEMKEDECSIGIRISYCLGQHSCFGSIPISKGSSGCSFHVPDCGFHGNLLFLFPS